MRVRLIKFVAGLLLVPFGRSNAQSRSFDALTIPAGAIVCHTVVATVADSASILVYMDDKTKDFQSRETIAGYDSTGAPLYIGVLAISEVADSSFVESFVVRFLAASRGHHASGAGPKPPESAPEDFAKQNFKPAVSLLSEAEVSRARVFSSWVWDRGCRSSRSTF